MFNVGSPELLVILVVALLVLGPAKLPEAARQVGRAMGELRRLSSGFQAELRDAIQEPVPSNPLPAAPPLADSATAERAAAAPIVAGEPADDDAPQA
jgi:Tat protein translocase TatB subunit